MLLDQDLRKAIREVIMKQQQSKTLKVYILISYFRDRCEIHEVFFNKTSAEIAKKRQEEFFKDYKKITTFHIIKKSIKDSHKECKVLDFQDALQKMWKDFPKATVSLTKLFKKNYPKRFPKANMY